MAIEPDDTVPKTSAPTVAPKRKVTVLGAGIAGMSSARELARSRGHSVERILVKPTLANLVLWRSVYLSDGVFHVEGMLFHMTGHWELTASVTDGGTTEIAVFDVDGCEF